MLLACHYQSLIRQLRLQLTFSLNPHHLEQVASLDNLSLNPVQYLPPLYFGHLLVETAKMQENVVSNQFDNAMATLKTAAYPTALFASQDCVQEALQR